MKGQGNGVDASVPEPPSQIPETSFVCEGKPYDPGMYADEETGCRVYHMCFRGRKEDFICGTGTIFNQETLTCDYPDNVDCGASATFYDANSEFGKGAPEPSGDQGAKPAGRPQAPRPQAPRPQQPAYNPGQSQQPETYAPQPAPAPRPRAQPPSKANPRPAAPRPQAPPPRQPPAYRPPAKTNPRPARPQRPVVQQQEPQQAQQLDYEPTNNVQFARRSGIVSPSSARRGQAAFRPQSQRWHMMSAAY